MKIDRSECQRLFFGQAWPLLILGVISLLFTGLTAHADGPRYPWVLITPQNNSSDPEMQAMDVADSQNMVSVINKSEKLFGHHVAWMKAPITELLSLEAPFSEMHFDAIKPLYLSNEEKSILKEYLKRGGFILFFIDAYPYPEEEFRAIQEWPLIDFLTKELPASDPDFSVGKATDDFPIFKIHYKTETTDSVKIELARNPNTPNRTLLFHQNRLCCFVMGRYSYMNEDRWIPLTRPFPRNFSMDLKSYELIVNIYTYSIMR